MMRYNGNNNEDLLVGIYKCACRSLVINGFGRILKRKAVFVHVSY